MSDALLLDYATPVEVCDERADIATELPLLLVGLNHRTAPVEIRERMSIGGGRLVEAVQTVARSASVNGVAVISTCNRTEVVVTSSSDDALSGVIDWLAEESGFSSETLRGFLYVLRGAEVVEHLYRVTSGIDSMIIGEPQIAGQVRKAFLASQDAGVTDALLHRLFENAMRVGKKVRTETGIGEHAVSVPYAAVELARKIFGEMSGLRALLLGAGEVGELVARHLASHGVEQIFVANKTYERAVELAERFGGSAVRFSAFETHLPECDIVIASTSAPHYVVAVEQIRRAVEQRRARSLFLLDLSIPRNIDPATAAVEGAYLFNIDDLRQVAAANHERREKKIAHAESIIAHEREAFRLRIAGDKTSPAIAELRSLLEGIRSAELEKCLQKMGPMTASQKALIEQLTVQMMNKIAHGAIVHLKTVQEPRERAILQRMIRGIFGG